MPLPARVPALSAGLVLALILIDPTRAAAEAAATVGPSVELLCADGRQAEGEAHLSGATALAVGSCTCPLDRIVEMSLPGETAGTIDQGAVLTDGTVLRGVAVNIEAGKLLLRSDLLGNISIDRSLVAAIALGPFQASQARDLASGPVGVRFPDGERFDGPIDYLNAKEVGVDAGSRVRRYARGRIQAVVMGPCVPAQGTWIQLAGGDLLSGSITAWEPDRIGFASSLKSTLDIPLPALRAVWSAAPALLPLDALRATELDVPLPTIVAPATLGALAPGRRAGPGLRHGIISCAGSTLRFEDIAGWTTLTGEVQAAPGCRGVACTVSADDRQLFTSGAMSAGDPPKVFSVSIAQARRLALVTTCSPLAGTGAVIWRWPTLVR